MRYQIKPLTWKDTKESVHIIWMMTFDLILGCLINMFEWINKIAKKSGPKSERK